MDEFKTRKPSRFETMLLVLAILAIAVGYSFVHRTLATRGVWSYESAVVMLLWIILIFFVILVLVSENSKEELKIIIRQQHQEISLMRHDLRRKR